MAPKFHYHAVALCDDSVQRLGSDFARILTGTEAQAHKRFRGWLEGSGPMYGFSAIRIDAYSLQSKYGAPVASYTMYLGFQTLSDSTEVHTLS